MHDNSEVTNKLAPYYRIVPVLIQAVLYWTTYAFFRICTRFHVEGRERVPKKGPIIFAVNHQNEWDGVLTRVGLPFFNGGYSPMYYVSLPHGKYEGFGWRGWIYNTPLFLFFGAYPTHSGKKDYAVSLTNHLMLLKNKRSLCIFPEGYRSKDGSFGQARGGVAFLSLESGAPIVPLAIRGMFRTRFRDLILRKRKVSLVYGKPIYPPKKEVVKDVDFHAYAQKVMDEVVTLHGVGTDPVRARMQQGKKFGFLVHPRGLKDFLLKFPFLRFLPRSVLLFLTKRLPPVVVSRIIGLKNTEGKVVRGEIIAITMTAKQMIEDREAAVQAIIKAVRFARSRNVGIIGLGALTASLTYGGKRISDTVSGIGITTGHAYTVKTVGEYVLRAIEENNLPKEKVLVAVVGAAGSIGAGVSKMLARSGVCHFHLIELEHKLDRLSDTLEALGKHREVSVEVDHRVQSIKDADIIVAATNAPEAVIRSDDLKPGAIVVNDAQPSDIDPTIIDERDDVLIIEGGVVSTPEVSCNFPLGLVDKHDTFCCLGEVLVLARQGHFKDYSLGTLKDEDVADITKRGEGFAITLARLQNSRGYIPDTTLKKVKRILQDRWQTKSESGTI